MDRNSRLAHRAAQNNARGGRADVAPASITDGSGNRLSRTRARDNEPCRPSPSRSGAPPASGESIATLKETLENRRDCTGARSSTYHFAAPLLVAEKGDENIRRDRVMSRGGMRFQAPAKKAAEA